MSKNFELLQQVGNDEELFRRTAYPGDAIPVADGEPSLELDKETLERILQKASLPDVFEIASDPEPQTLAARSELSPDLNVEGASGNPQGTTSAYALRTSKNPADPIGELEKHAENRATRSVASGASLPQTFHVDRKPKASPSTVSQKPLPDAKKKVQQGVSQKLSLSFPWLDSLGKGAKKWGSKLQARNGRHG